MKKKKSNFSLVTLAGYVKNSLRMAMKKLDHCHITRKFRGVALWSCNINFQLTKKVPVIFHNLRGYDSHFDVKIDVIPSRLEKYMGFILNKNLVFIDSMQFMNSSLEKLVKNLSNNDFK